MKAIKIALIGAALAVLSLLACECNETPTGTAPYKGVWELTPTPEDSGSVTGIYMLSGTEGWAAYSVSDTLREGHSEIWRWDGSRWEVNTTLYPRQRDWRVGLTSIWFNGPGDGWVCGVDDQAYGNESHSRMWHYDGTRWVEVAIPEVHYLSTLWFNSPMDGWAFGGDYALRWDGSTWNVTTFPTLYWTGCFFWSANDGWATSMGSIYRWDGSSWTLSYTADSRINCIGFATPTNGWALGESWYGGGRAWHWNGATWKEDERWDNLKYDAWFLDVGFAGAAFGCAVANTSYFWDGISWKRFDLAPTKDYKGYNADCVFIINDKDVWLGGDAYGVIARFRGFGDG